MLRVSYSILLVLTLNIMTLYGQVVLNEEVDFIDGIYFSCENFNTNKPSIHSKDYYFEETPSSNNYQRYIHHLRANFPSDTLKIRNIWGICIDGLPYINQHIIRRNYSKEAEIKNYGLFSTMAYTFSRITSLGHLCQFFVGGQKSGFLKTGFENPDFFKPIVLNVTTEKIIKFNYDRVLEMIITDKDLYYKYENLDIKQRNKKEVTYQMIKEFNLRNPVYLIG